MSGNGVIIQNPWKRPAMSESLGIKNYMYQSSLTYEKTTCTCFNINMTALQYACIIIWFRNHMQYR